MIKPGTTVKVKSTQELIKITGCDKHPNERSIRLDSGLYFHAAFLQLACKVFTVDLIAEPGTHRGEENGLKENSYRLGGTEVYLTEDLLEVVG